ncbi:atrial natriuretic peptide receptor 1-like [Ptychodera flava]|uniref:atrial natriuretic peptide receptor 1-like n=1 Tax=Ptychodera flava TaxID=63121 RepID=UPI00396AAD25
MLGLAKIAPLFLVVLFSPRLRTDEFRVLLMMPSIQVLPYHITKTGPAALNALDKVNNDTSLLAGHTLTYDLYDTVCNPINTLGTVVEMMKVHNYTGFIGPLCSLACRLTARLAVFYNLPTFSGICSSNEMQNKDEFKTLIRTFGPMYKMGAFFKSICDTLGWDLISIIRDDFTTWEITSEGIKLAVEEANFTVSYYFHGDLHSENLEKILEEAVSVSRIIVLGMPGELVRQFMIIANRMGLINGEYAFVCIYLFQDVQAHGDFSWDQGTDPEENAQAKEAYEALLFLGLYEPDTEEFQTFSQEVKERSAAEFGYVYADDEKVTLLAAMVHDSIILYAVALNETLAENGNPYDGFTIAHRMYSRNELPGVLQMTIDDNGDMDSDYMLLDMQYNEAGEFELVTVGKYFGKRKVYEPVFGVPIAWPAGADGPPLDTPICGFEGELCFDKEPLSPLAIMAIIICIFLVILFLVAGVLYRRFKLQKEIAEMLWKISVDDIILEQKGALSASSMISLGTAKGEIRDEQLFIKVANVKGSRQALKSVDYQKMVINQKTLIELKNLREINHPNLTRFVGACVDPSMASIVLEYCPKGSLQDILENESIKLDWMFRYSLIFDIVKGMDFIQGSFLKSTGNLKSSNCLVDSRFVLKVTDFGLNEWRDHILQVSDASTHSDFYNLLWRSPELLIGKMPPRGTQKGDVYGFGIILQEVITRTGPYDHELIDENLSPQDIIRRVMEQRSIPYRPRVNPSDAPDDVIQLMQHCWSEEPSERPDFSKLKTHVRKMNAERGNSENILDNLLTRMEQYANNLEGIVAQRTAQLVEEQRKSEQLLQQLLPKSVAEQLKQGKSVDAEAFDSVTIFFSDIVGFTSLSAASTPLQVVDLLNDLYTCFDAIIDHFDVYKVETIGDAYMVVSGLPITNGNLHAREISRMALRLLESVETFKIRHRPEEKLKLRIGIHTGSVVAGVVGLKMPRYCLFGDTVNTASRMESNGEALKIHISASTCNTLNAIGGFILELRGEISMKGKGLVTTYWLKGESPVEDKTSKKDVIIDENIETIA